MKLETIIYSAGALVSGYLLVKMLTTPTGGTPDAPGGGSGIGFDPTYPPAGGVMLEPATVTFANDSTELRYEFEPMLEDLAELVARTPLSMLSIHGFADSTGAETYNRMLSQARADAVADALYDNGVDRHRMTVAGHGEAYPVAPNNTSAGRAANRRVEVWVIQNATA